MTRKSGPNIACGAVNAVPLVMGTSKEVACNSMAVFRAATDRSSELSAAEHAASGGVIMQLQVAKAFSRYGLTKRQIVSGSNIMTYIFVTHPYHTRI